MAATAPDALEAFAARETNRALLSRASVAEALMLLHGIHPVRAAVGGGERVGVDHRF